MLTFGGISLYISSAGKDEIEKQCQQLSEEVFDSLDAKNRDDEIAISLDIYKDIYID